MCWNITFLLSPGKTKVVLGISWNVVVFSSSVTMATSVRNNSLEPSSVSEVKKERLVLYVTQLKLVCSLPLYWYWRILTVLISLVPCSLNLTSFPCLCWSVIPFLQCKYTLKDPLHHTDTDSTKWCILQMQKHSWYNCWISIGKVRYSKIASWKFT